MDMIVWKDNKGDEAYRNYIGYGIIEVHRKLQLTNYRDAVYSG